MKLICALVFGWISAATAAAQFVQLAPLPQGVWGHAMVTAQGSVYVIGGVKEFGGFFYADIVYRAPVTGNGALGTWMQEASLPRRVFFHDAVAWNDRIYVLGGHDSDGVNYTPSEKVHYSSVAANGTPGPWIETTPLPHALVLPAAVVVSGAIYVTGGFDFQSDFRDVYRSVIQPDGSLGPWLACTPTPRTLLGHACVATDRIYVLGGATDFGVTMLDEVQSAPILGNHSVGPWWTTTPLPAALAQHAAVLHGSRAFVIGGVDPNGFASGAVLSAAIDAQGGLGTWSVEPSLPQAVFATDAVVVGDWMYAVGGSINGLGTPVATVLTMNLAACSNDVYVDLSYSGAELGTQAQPFNTLVEGLAETCAAGTLWIAAGTYDEPAPLSITQPVTLKALGGAVHVR